MRLPLLLIAVLTAQSVFSQQWSGSANTSGLITRDGSLLVGDATSHVNVGTTGRAIELTSADNSVFFIRSNGYPGNLQLAFFPSTGLEYSGLLTSLPLHIKAGSGNNGMILQTNGNVLIGKALQTNTSYILDVSGSVRADKVVVNSTGADFVFDSTYRLLPLPDVKRYIEANHHLPGVPAAKETVKQGLDLEENQTRLLQKIEELTLYILDLQTQMAELKKKLEKEGH